MDTKDSAKAQCQLNKSDNNIEPALHESGMLYFRPETEEIIFVPQSEAGEFENHWRDMLARVDHFHQANHAYSAAIEEYGQQKMRPGITQLDLDAQVKNVVEAETALDKKREALLEKLKDGESSDMGYQDVVELLPLHDTRRRGPGNQALGRRYAYASQRYLSERSGGRSQDGTPKTWRTLRLRNRDTNTGGDSIYSVDRHGRRKIDAQKLKKQLTEDRLPVFKAELKDFVNLDDYNIDKTLFDWAESWNKSVEGSKTFDNGIEISGAAQFMRFISNVGAETEFNPNEGKVSIKGEAKTTLSVASGVAKAATFIPDRLGWNLSYTPEAISGYNSPEQTVATISMGVIRVCIENTLIGFMGASAQVEAQLQIMVNDKEQQIVAGQPQGRLPRFKARQDATSGQFYRQMQKADEGVTVSAEAFAGAKVEYALKGVVQWLEPVRPAEAGKKDIPKTAGEFSDFATIGTSIAGLAGVGAGAHFWCTFINGKFCFKIAASLCCGAGAKGAFMCEVGYKKIWDFGRWLIYQLFRLDYHFYELVAQEAFKTYSQISVMQLVDIKNDIYRSYNEAKTIMTDVADEFGDFITGIIDESVQAREASSKRNQLAKNIIADPEQLLTYTPEAKGILLYVLTRHGKWDHVDVQNRGGYLLDIYTARKEAVLQVLYSIQTRREWTKVMCHRSADGSDLVLGGSEEAVENAQVQQLREFLQEGFNRDEEMDRKAASLIITDIVARLKTPHELSVGYALAMNNTPYYNLNRAPNSHFPQRCEFGPCDATTQLA